MANICLYKIKVKGTKAACYALVDMMPLYSYDKIFLNKEGTDDDYTLVFTGDCKWGVNVYTEKHEGLIPFTPEEIAKIEDGDYWEYPIQEKSLLLGCEIFCNSKDIDDASWSNYIHYKNGIEIKDECPKELHIKRGRDYDEDYVPPEKQEKNTPACKVKFDGGKYLYAGNYKIGDIVKVEGAKQGYLGIVTELEKVIENNCLYKIIEYVGHIDNLQTEFFENLWNSYKAKERKEYLTSLGLDEKTTKKKFISTMEFKWIDFALQNNNDFNKFKKDILNIEN